MTFSLGNYGYLQARIADELGDRQALRAYNSTSALSGTPGFATYGGYIQDAIQTAIAKWERERFYFNEVLVDTPLGAGYYPWMTSRGQEYYGDATSPVQWQGPKLSTIAKIDKMWALINAQRYAITARVFQYVADVSVNQAVLAYPTDFTWAADMGRFYPVPDGNYPIGFLGTQRFQPLVALKDANPWTTEAFDLIRCEAKMDLASNLLHNAAMAKEAELAIYGDPSNPAKVAYLNALRRETNRRRGSGNIRPTYF